MDPTGRIEQSLTPLGHPHPITVPLRDVSVLDRRLLGLILLVAYASFTCLAGLRSGVPLFAIENTNIRTAREAIANGQWLIPRLGDEPQVRRAPLGVWSIAAAAKLVPGNSEPEVTEFAARLPSALAALVTVAAVYWLGAMLFGHRTGLVGAFIAASCAATLCYARIAQVDQLLAMFTALSFAFFWRGAFHQHLVSRLTGGGRPSGAAMAAFFVCFALAMMAKAPLPLVTVGLSLAVYWFLTLPLIEAAERGPLPKRRGRLWVESMSRRIQGLRGLWLLPGLLLFIIIAAAWPAYVYFKVDDVIPAWRSEYMGRLTGMDAGAGPFWYYLPFIFAFTVPFLAFLPEGAAALFLPRYAGRRRALGYVFTWAVVTTIFLSFTAFKRPHYLLSAVPALCLLLAPVVDRVFFGTLMSSTKIVRLGCGSMSLLIGVFWALAIVWARRDYPQYAGVIALGLGAAALCWLGACMAFYAHCRRSSFALLLLGIPLMLAVGFAGFKPAPSSASQATPREEIINELGGKITGQSSE